MAIDGRRSNFPDGVDQFLELFDLPYNKVRDAERLSELRRQETLTDNEQNEVLSLTASLRENMLTVESFNKLQDSMYALQLFFNQNVHGYIENKQKIWDTYIKDFSYAGKWVSGKAYKFQNMVTNNRGDLFICRVNHTSTESNQPSESGDTTQWAKVGSKGDRGEPGVTGNFKGGWSPTTSYSLNDSVYAVDTGVNGGLLFIAKRDNVGKNPETSSDDWFMYTKQFVGVEEPLGAGEGLHFIKIVE